MYIIYFYFNKNFKKYAYKKRHNDVNTSPEKNTNKEKLDNRDKKQKFNMDCKITNMFKELHG